MRVQLSQVVIVPDRDVSRRVTPAHEGLGTRSPSRRASERPIAIACFRLVTFLPEPPERSVPFLSSRMTFSTFLPAPLPYFFVLFFLGVAMGEPERKVRADGAEVLTRTPEEE
jgi:hypothetical protein